MDWLKATITGPDETTDWTEWQQHCRKLVEERVPVKVDPRCWRFQPWGHRILVLRGGQDTMTEGGIHLPQQSQEPPCWGWVVNSGPEVGQEKCGTSPHSCPVIAVDLVGCRVYFGPHAGFPMSFGKATSDQAEFGDYVLMTDGDVFGWDWSLDLPRQENVIPIGSPGLERARRLGVAADVNA
jgi:co-chaperonin GroES (HSP10)